MRSPHLSGVLSPHRRAQFCLNACLIVLLTVSPVLASFVLATNTQRNGTGVGLHTGSVAATVSPVPGTRAGTA